MDDMMPPSESSEDEEEEAKPIPQDEKFQWIIVIAFVLNFCYVFNK